MAYSQNFERQVPVHPGLPAVRLEAFGWLWVNWGIMFTNEAGLPFVPQKIFWKLYTLK